MHGWIEPFYEPAEPAIEPGHIWCDQPIYLPPRHGLKIERVTPRRSSSLRCTARTSTTNTRAGVSPTTSSRTFYLPSGARPHFDEGFARLDHTQPVRQALLVEPRGLKLSSDAVDALVEWFVAFSTNRQLDDSLILEYRREKLAGNS